MHQQKNKVFFHLLQFVLFLYLFFVSIELMSGAFKLFGKGFAEGLMTTTANPVVGLFIGMVATSLIQSSSSTTSILVGLVASGSISITGAIPILMGANIGTTVTNTIVSLGHLRRRKEFSKAMAGAILHDFFNILAVLLFLPLELFTHFIEKSALFLSTTFQHVGGMTFVSPLKAIVKPVAQVIIKGISLIISSPDWALSITALTIALIILFIALKNIVDVMKKVIIGRVESMLHQYLFNSQIRSFLLGLVLTAIVQSSSATTSIVVPIVGAGIISLQQIFPYVLGANIGTTVTAILASMVTKNPAALTVAFAHLCFNISATVLLYPIKIVPITMAKHFGMFMARQRVLAVVYILLFFFALPLIIIFVMKGGF